MKPVPIEQEMQGRDANGRAMLLAGLLFLWGAVDVLVVRDVPYLRLKLVQMLVGAPAFVYFLARRGRPSVRLATGFAALVILYTAMFLPLAAIHWNAFGRPLETFPVPQLAAVVTPLVVPGYLWMSIGASLVFGAEAIFAWAYAHHVGMGALIPNSEPMMSLLFVLFGCGLAILREQRRRLSLRHIRAQAELEALRRVGPTFDGVRRELATRLASITSGLGRLSSQAPYPAPLDRAVTRLDAVRGQLEQLVEAPLNAPTSRGQEQQLLAGDAHLGATILCALGFAFIGLIAVFRLPLPTAHWLPMLLLSGLCLLYLYRTRHRPSELAALLVVVLLWLLVLPLVSLNQAKLLTLHRPYTPLMGHKLLVVILGLVAASRVWLGGLMIALTTVVGLVVFVSLDLGSHRDLIPGSEPWVFLAYVMIGAASLVMRAQRRLVSLQLLRDEGEAQALRRRATLFLALRDQLNTPLQTLVLAAAQLTAKHPEDEVAAVNAGIDPLIKLSQQLSALDSLIPKESHQTSLDAQQAMRPQL